jgi:toxin ParE1/3/4
MKIFYTHNAIKDLQRLYGFIANENPIAAAEVSARLRQAIKRLIDFPMLGREIKSGGKTVSLRDLVTGKYIIRYAFLKHEIHILRIWHGKEDR